MLRRLLTIAICGLSFLGVSLMADTLVLIDGTRVQGRYAGGTATTITFASGGTSLSYAIQDIVSLTFQQDRPTNPPAGAYPAGRQSSGPVSINAGTQLMVRTQSSLETGIAKTGDRFTASLEADLVVGGEVVAPRGSTVYGRVVKSSKAGRVVGRAKLQLELTDLMINNQMYPVISDQVGYEGERSGTLKKVAVGAAAGGIIDGSKGAGTGAAVGGGLAVLTKGRQIQIPAGSILQFRTLQSISITSR